MRLLVIGGCGTVGSMVLPHLATTHRIRVLDLAALAAPVSEVEYHTGDLHDVDLVATLAAGTDSLVFMAMGPKVNNWHSATNARGHLDVAVPGLYSTLTGVHQAGVRHVVYTSSMSVYPFPLGGGNPAPGEDIVVSTADGPLGRYPDDSTPPDATDFYGLAKRLAEEVCRSATVAVGMDVVSLRLCYPVPDDAWPRAGDPMRRVMSTSARDVARAIDAALSRRGHGFDCYSISGDGAERTMSLAKAKQELGWAPLDDTSAIR
ncbi:NAD-dependent epimerase/dehydratase family protein [Actinophytocola sediminis]